MEALRWRGLQVQCFLSRACFDGYHGSAVATGLNPRHLDTWLMSPEACREIFAHGVEGCDVAVIEGRFGRGPADDDGAGGNLDLLCDWLDLPRLAVLDASRLDTCCLPRRPAADGLLLDCVRDQEHAARVTTNLEALWGIPVLGSLETLPALRAQIAATPPGTRPSRDLVRHLGDHFLRHAKLRRIMDLGQRRTLAWTPPGLFPARPQSARVVVALAYDAAFDCYFQDTLDLLEARGASIVDFSPLFDERLPDGTDIVYLGCGHPERHVDELSANHCMKLALRNHVRAGGRIYAEGGGLAYLCQYLLAPEGQLQRMAGVFPALARFQAAGSPSQPVEITLNRAAWLGERGVRLRGYRNPIWSFEPLAGMIPYVAQLQHRYELMGVGRAIGSRLHLDFAAQPDLFPRFFQPLLHQADPVGPGGVPS